MPWPSQEVIFYSQNWEKLKMLKKKEKDMIEQSNSWKQFKQPGVKRKYKDWIVNEQMQKEHHAEQTFDDVDQAMKQYHYITG